MSAFLLSPGITPELADAFVIELPVAVGLGYLLARRTGFEVAFALNALALGAIKLVTDYGDLLDAAIALATLAGGGAWLHLAFRRSPMTETARGLFLLVGATSLVAGLVKLQDFYDPFDLLLADAAIVAGIAILRHAWRPSPPESDPVRVPLPVPS